MKRRLAVLLVLVLAVPAAFAAPSAVKSMELPDRPFDRMVHAQQMQTLHERLSASMVELALTVPLEVRVDAADRGSRDLTPYEQKMRVGVAEQLAVPVDFTARRPARGVAALHDTFGAIRGDENGGFVWDGVIRSPEAAASRVHIVGLDLPAGAELYVYTRDGMAYGPYTGRGPNGDGDFWTNTVAGEEVILQLHAGPMAVPEFTIAGFGHLTPDFKLAKNLNPSPQAGTAPCAGNADCVVDAACTNQDAGAVATAKDAVAEILFISGAYWYICSGGLLADSDTGTNVPYFLTANHCVSASGEASSLETFFFYAASSCGACPDLGTANTNGSTIVASNRTSDYTLLRLSQNAPAGAAFLGWNTAAVANSNGTGLYRISHPQGSPQSYSEHVVDTSKPTCRSWPRGSWIYSRDIYGATEGGSSGSPVVNGAGQVVGQLSGACGYNVNDVCDVASNATVDGAFAAYYPSISGILGSGGGGGCTDADGDGFCVSQGDCNDNNAAVYPGANDTKGKRGRDGVDNDCDGTPDA